MHFFFFWLLNFLKSAEVWAPEDLDLVMAGPDIMIDG